MSVNIKVVPFTDDELQEIQLSLTEQVLDIKHQAEKGSISADAATKQIQALSKVIKKCSLHQRNAPSPLTTY